MSKNPELRMKLAGAFCYFGEHPANAAQRGLCTVSDCSDVVARLVRP